MKIVRLPRPAVWTTDRIAAPAPMSLPAMTSRVVLLVPPATRAKACTRTSTRLRGVSFAQEHHHRRQVVDAKPAAKHAPWDWRRKLVQIDGVGDDPDLVVVDAEGAKLQPFGVRHGQDPCRAVQNPWPIRTSKTRLARTRRSIRGAVPFGASRYGTPARRR